MITKVLLTKLKDFFESEAVDPGYITAKYVYRIWGGQVAIGDIAAVMADVRRMM